jgi:hypothetical protein
MPLSNCRTLLDALRHDPLSRHRTPASEHQSIN